MSEYRKIIEDMKEYSIDVGCISQLEQFCVILHNKASEYAEKMDGDIKLVFSWPAPKGEVPRAAIMFNNDI